MVQLHASIRIEHLLLVCAFRIGEASKGKRLAVVKKDRKIVIQSLWYV